MRTKTRLTSHYWIFRNSSLLSQYRFKRSLLHRTASAKFVGTYNDTSAGGEFRGDILSYLRKLGRLLGNEVGDNKWGDAATYDDTRKIGNVAQE